MTNADKIKEMTDEHEMARFILQLQKKANGYTDTVLGIIELLKQEVTAMREILFRGRRADTGDWVKGFYVQKPNPFSEDGKPIRHCIVDLPPFGYDVDPETVGQFTGLLDKNGTKIFEGDILTDPDYPDHTTGAIYYGRTNCSCCDGVYGFYSKEDADLRNADDLTVIGNIHDNPELLEGGGEDG